MTSSGSNEIPLFFKNLSELDKWVSTPHKSFTGLLPYIKRSGPEHSGKGKLLVCHDYKGGYTEGPTSLSYTFNFWDRCDTFIYFAHHRVTIPPAGWVTAAHRQGVKILGTLIVEEPENGPEDTLRLLVGHLPKSTYGPGSSSPLRSLPISPYYAEVLADLAAERGFDGYLLNFEYPLQGGTEHARALDTWVSLLTNQLLRKVGPHAQTVWYDSVVVTGHLRWQDRLNSLNLPFFLSSTSIFTNYTWPPHFPSLTAQYFSNLDDSLFVSRRKTLQDIFIGVDIWGRGSHGGGGFGAFRAISHADPQFLGLSVALFGQAWTWESEQDKDGWNWQKWWAYERRLWVGPQDEKEKIIVPPMTRHPAAPPCSHEDYVPLSHFFPKSSPPNPSLLTFFTSFSPGVGYKWFIEGRMVEHKSNGWTDIEKQTSLGDMIWPHPKVRWEGELENDVLPSVIPSLSFDDAWLGGSSLHLDISFIGTPHDDAVYKCFWVPIQSIVLTPLVKYHVSLIHKADPGECEVEVAIGLRSLSGEDLGEDVDIKPMASSHLQSNWVKTDLEMTLSTSSSDYPKDVQVALGLRVAVIIPDPSSSTSKTFLLKLGMISVHQASQSDSLQRDPRILWGSCSVGAESLTLNWGVSVSFPSPPTLLITSPEDPRPAWLVDQHRLLYPYFMYFHVFSMVQSDAPSRPPESARFIGVSRSDGTENCFTVKRQSLPQDLRDTPLRFFIQGVTDDGSVLPWSHCLFVDTPLM